MAVSILKSPCELRFQKQNGRHVNASVPEVKRLLYKSIAVILCNGHSPADKSFRSRSGYVTVVAVGQRQRLYSGVSTFTGFSLSSMNMRIVVKEPKPYLSH